MALFDQIKNINALSGARKLALDSFLELGFPDRKDEEYKYTNLREIISKDYQFEIADSNGISAEFITGKMVNPENFRLVFVNGKYSQNLSSSLPEKWKFSSLSGLNLNSDLEAVADLILGSISNGKSAFTDLNNALYTDGTFLKIPQNTVAERPLEILYISDTNEDFFSNVRNLLIVEKSAQIEVIEQHINCSENFAFTNAVTEIFVDSNARADWHKLQNDSETSYLVDHTFAKQERDSQTTVNTFSFGGKLVRNNLDFIQNGENINSFMNGITIIGGEQLVDHHTAVHHNQPNCESYQNYKGIFKDKSHGVFNGKVFVDKIAQKTNAYQQNNNVLLSEGASIDTKPQLEIFADDVKCSHGCTVGQLNEDALFYLRARGISKKEAQALLLYAFANDAMQNIDIEPLKNKISKLLAEKLEVGMAF